MPTYQYACTACDERLEAVQSFTDAALVECPLCGGRLRKVFSAVGVVFKGSGFYKNDSRSSKGSGDAGKSDSNGDSGKGDSGKGDSAKTDAPKADAPKADAPKKDAAAKPSSTPASKSA